MDTDLFSLQGIVVVQDNIPATELFSLQGVVIEKSSGSAAIGQLRLLGTQNTMPVGNVAQLRLLGSQSSPGSVLIPTAVTGLDNFKAMAQRRATATLDWATIGIGKPTRDTSAGPTRTLVTLTPALASIYRLPLVVGYDRRSIGLLADLVLVPGSVSTLAEFVAAIRAKGYLIEMGDVDATRSRITSEVIKVYAHNDSYFFYKDSSVTFGHETTLAEEFTVTVAQGFIPA